MVITNHFGHQRCCNAVRFMLRLSVVITVFVRLLHLPLLLPLPFMKGIDIECKAK